jgi:hypothetical protein
MYRNIFVPGSVLLIFVTLGCGSNNPVFSPSSGQSSTSQASDDSTPRETIPSPQISDERAVPPSIVTGSYLTCIGNPNAHNSSDGFETATCGLATPQNNQEQFVDLSNFTIIIQVLDLDAVLLEIIVPVLAADKKSFQIHISRSRETYSLTMKVSKNGVLLKTSNAKVENPPESNVSRNRRPGESQSTGDKGGRDKEEKR